MIDAKSIIGVFGIQEGKELVVEMLGANKEEIVSFIEKIKVYEARNNEND